MKALNLTGSGAGLYGVIRSSIFEVVALRWLTVSACIVLVVALTSHVNVLKVFVVSKIYVVIAQYLVNKSLFWLQLARKRYHFVAMNKFFAYLAKKHIILSQKLMKYVDELLGNV